MKRWKCLVCGYIHTGDQPPEKCPVCGAPKSQFILLEEKVAEAGQVRESSPPADQSGGNTGGAAQSFACQVCGYIHAGEQAPQKCPVCGAPQDRFERQETALPADEEDDASTQSLPKREPETFQTLSRTIKPVSQLLAKADLLTKLHGHPISVHIPNGVLPVTVIFTLLAMLFKYEPLAVAARFNCIFVAISMPLVLITGFVDWFNRFGGHLTSIFKIKISCGLIVSALTLVLALWWSVDPQIYLGGKPGSSIFLLINLVDFGAAAVAGFYGGKLVFKD